MTPANTPVTQRSAEASDTTDPHTRTSPARTDDHEQPEPRSIAGLAVWGGIAVALTVAVAVLVPGLSGDGAEPVGLHSAIPADITMGDPAVGVEIYVEDLRSVGRIDPIAGREVFVEDLRSIGRDTDAWRAVYFEDLRSIDRIDPVAGRQAYFEDLRSVGHVDADAWRDIYFDDLRSVGR